MELVEGKHPRDILGITEKWPNEDNNLIRKILFKMHLILKRLRL